MSDTPHPAVQQPSPEQLAAFEAELKRLSEELDRFAKERADRTQKLSREEVLKLLRSKWSERQMSTDGDTSETWKKEFDSQLSHTLERVLEEGLVDKPEGGVGFTLPTQAIAETTAPLLKKLLEGFAQSLSARFQQEAEQAAATTSNAPANPFAGLITNLGQAFAGALGNLATNIKLDGNTFSFSSPGASFTSAPASSKTPTEPANAAGIAGEQEAAAAPTAASEAAANTTDTAPSAESTEEAPAKPVQLPELGQLFQQMISGLGGAIRQTLGPNPGATVGQALSGLLSQAMQRAQPQATDAQAAPDAAPAVAEPVAEQVMEEPTSPLSEEEQLAQVQAQLAAAEAELARVEQEAIDLFTKTPPPSES